MVAGAVAPAETGGLEALPDAVEPPPTRPVQWWRMLLALMGAAVLVAAVVIGAAWLIAESSGSPLWTVLPVLLGISPR